MDTKSNKRPREEITQQRLVSKVIIYDKSKPNQWLDDPPLEIWDHVIIPMLGLKDLALARLVCTFFEAYWQDKFSNNVLPLRVGLDVATIDDVMGVIGIFCDRRRYLSRYTEYTKSNPLVVLLGKGEHQITSSWTSLYSDAHQTTLSITRSNITFVGKGKDTTTILGGFYIGLKRNITFKQMTVTNTSTGGDGIRTIESKVELIDVALKGCTNAGLRADADTILVATRCEFANNSRHGAFVIGCLTSTKFNNCVFNENKSNGIEGIIACNIHLYGEVTAIHLNGRYGISATGRSKVIIHLPSHHNTTYNNGDEDRRTNSINHWEEDGSITNVED